MENTTHLPGSPRRIVTVGFGNTLRSDEAVGIRIATTVADWNLPQVRALAVPQLTRDLADVLQDADLVVFVDACTDRATCPCGVQLTTLYPSRSPLPSSEFACDPRSLLATTQARFGRVPQAWWMTVPGTDFEVGVRLSPLAELGMARALSCLEVLLGVTSWPSKEGYARAAIRA